MSSKLNEKDKELLIGNEPFDYNTVENTYFGGYFGNNSADYVEVMIHDTNDNLLETAVADSSDYYYDSQKGGMKLKTGTILRKLGYDRGRFKVTYNFLRKLAGSYQTVVTDQTGNIFNGEVDINEIDKTLFVKEDKYITHEISPSRNEIRLVTQNIRDEKYIRDFYRLAARNKKVTADASSFSNIEFVGTAEEKSNSTQIRFVPSAGFGEDGVFEDSMVGGTISIPNFFLVDRIFPPPILSADDVGLGVREVINSELFQASFFLDENAGVKEFKKNTSGKFGDTNFSPAYSRFKDLTLGQESQTFQQWDDGVDFEGDGRTLDDVRNLSDSKFNCVYLKRKDPKPVIDFVSNSFLRADTTVVYKWEVTGWDKDGNSWNRIQPRPDGADEGGDFRIITPDQTYATRTAQSSFVATQTISGETSDGTNRDGSRLRLELFSKDCHIGIKLTINDNTANDSSTIHLPAIIETH
jgi:hypothetical protein